MPLPTTFTGWSSLSMIASPHLLQMRLVRWLSSSRFASEARAVFESSPFLGIDSRPLSPICLTMCVCLDFQVPYYGQYERIMFVHIGLVTVYHNYGRMSNLRKIWLT